MNKKDMKQMFIIMAMAKALDDQLLLIESKDLKQMNKVIFKRLVKESSNIYKVLDRTLGMNNETVEAMTDSIHDFIETVKSKIDIKD
jgi:hypothetical protein